MSITFGTPTYRRTATLGATIVDSIDTLYITGLKDEYNQAIKNWIKENFNPEAANNEIPVFETTIR